ncbi:DUF2357 domain-containing protein [Oceanithermus sp.]|uniref:DUF2357 domain-containing protein n=1 Tax=Oceanithermus sp. TaxID=2268145 RepID=UPI00257F1F37|nr:DUF2357 domain-containing protein [Oceanithermus sp.]
MSREIAFLLEWPWGLLDREARTPLRAAEALVELRSDRAPLLCLSDEEASGPWRVGRGRAVLQPETPAFSFASRRWWICTLPLPRTADETVLELSRGPGESLRFRFRKRAPAGEPDDGPDFDALRSRAVERMLGLLGALRGERQEDPLLLTWSDVAERWLMRREPFDPRLAVVVRHARELRALLGELARHPRRVLRREHRLLPLHRAQEWDRRALLWYARRPGRTLAEKAGPGQTVLALAREEDHDTLENRVLRHLLELSRQAADDWCEAHPRLQGSLRFAEVERYGRITASLARDLARGDVRLPASDVRPNYPLLFDPRYRRVWTAYRELLRERWRRDEVRRWAHRLFDEVIRILVHATLVAEDVPDARPLAASGYLPLVLRGEQERGRFAVPHAGSLFAAAADGSLAVQVVEPAQAGSADGPVPEEIAIWWPVHAVLALRIERPGTRQRAWLGVFAIWQDDWERVRKEGMPSLDRALARLAEELELRTGERVPLGALAFVRTDPETGVDFDQSPDRRIILVRLPVDDAPFPEGIWVVRMHLEEFAERWLA